MKNRSICIPAVGCFHNCININECGTDTTAGTDKCSTNTACRDIEDPSPTDVPLGYVCDCNDGYEALTTDDNGFYVCSNIDECTTTDPDKMHNCDSRNTQVGAKAGFQIEDLSSISDWLAGQIQRFDWLKEP